LLTPLLGALALKQEPGHRDDATVVSITRQPRAD
jgi:hypothetical protein